MEKEHCYGKIFGLFAGGPVRYTVGLLSFSQKAMAAVDSIVREYNMPAWEFNNCHREGPDDRFR